VAAAKKRPAKKAKAPAKRSAPSTRRAVVTERAERVADRAAAIRIAAFRCFGEAGFHATSVDDICAAAGVSKGTFYWYFETKEQVFVQILDVWADEVEAEIMAQFRAAFEEKDPVQALLVALGREGRRGRRLLPVWLDALVQSQRHPELSRALASFLVRVRRSLAQVVAPTFAGFYDDKQIETLAGLLLSSFIGSISQDMAEPDHRIYDEQSRMLLVTVEHFGRLLSQTRQES
jgi:AcrR family transcriptional regulator